MVFHSGLNCDMGANIDRRHSPQYKKGVDTILINKAEQT